MNCNTRKAANEATANLSDIATRWVICMGVPNVEQIGPDLCCMWHGRNSKGLVGLLQAPGTLLNEYIHNIHVIEDPATAGISSTNIRHELQQVSLLQSLLQSSMCSNCGNAAHLLVLLNVDQKPVACHQLS